MSSAKSAQTISRHWELLQILPNRAPGAEAKHLTAQLIDRGYQVTKRTVERDLQMLSGIFPLQCNDKSSPYGWYWMQDAAINLPGISLMDAISLQLVEETIRYLLPPSMLQPLTSRFMQAHNKLHSLNNDTPGAKWIDKVAVVQPGMAMQQPKLDAAILETVQQALLHNNQLEALYNKAHDSDSRKYCLNPLGIIQRGSITYLIATKEPYLDPLRFAMHRFEHVQLLDSPTKQPEQFSLQSYLATGAMQFSEGEQIQLEAEVNSVIAHYLAETPLSDDMVLTPQDEENYHLTATVFSGWQLNLWLMSQSNNLTVLAPSELRDNMRQQLAKANARYE